MSYLAAITRVTVKSGFRAIARQTLASSLPRASVAIARPNLARSFAISTRLQNKSSLEAADAQLVKVLKTEIKCEIAEAEDDPVAIAKFLESSGFSVVEKEGNDEVELIKKVNGETVHVFFSVSDITNDSPESMYEAEEDGEDFDMENMEAELAPIRVNVVVEKAAGNAIGVECVLQHSIFMIESVTPYATAELALSPSAEFDYKRRENYQGPPFINLDENVQSSFEKFIEVRGIDLDLAEFILEFSAHRENKEYLNWLKNIKTILESKA